MGKKPADRVKALLVKLDSMRRSKERGFNVTNDIRRTSGKFAGRVAKIFKNLPKPLEWQSFYRHDLPILMDICEEVQKVSIQNDLNRSQIRALETLKEVSSEEFQRVITHDQEPSNLVKGPDRVGSDQIELKDLSAREIKDSISVLSRKDYLKFFRELFPLFREYTKTHARIAFLNADWPLARRAYALSEL